MKLPFLLSTSRAQTAPEEPSLLAYPWHRLLLGALVVGLVALVSASQGTVSIPLATLVRMVAAKLPFLEVSQNWPDSWEAILWQLRMPRVVLAGLVGAALAVSGAAYQGLFRNPLADPYLIGVAAGAALGATVALVTPVPLYFHGLSVLPLAAFLGALSAVGAAYWVARRSHGLHLTTLVLAGVAVASLYAAVSRLLLLHADPDVRPLLAWLLGTLGNSQWRDVLITLPYIVLGTAVMLAYGRLLNVLQLDEEEARQLGVRVEVVKVVLIGAASLTTAAAVSVSGLIGFVGLVAPHAVRLVWGHDYRTLLPMALIVGAGFLILADLASRLAARPGELPVGVVTAFCGAPFFLYLLTRTGRRLP